MTRQKLTLEQEKGRGIIVAVDGAEVGVIKDGSTLIARVDRLLKSAGYVRTTGYSVDRIGIDLAHVLKAEVGVIA